tara:strand:- start:450 stop:1199 length:750 start_codon:yes stop_codon:yes gene_type:complete
MKVKLLDKAGKVKKEIELPKNFAVKIRNDVLQKVFEVQKGFLKSAYGAMEGAGAGYSASGILKHKRHDWKSSYGRGISRVPRKIFSRHGASFNWQAATVASTRGGRKPTAPKSEKNLFKKVNKKEFLLAMNSAFAGTLEKGSYVFDAGILELKSKDFFAVLKNVFADDFVKVLKKKSVRAGKGKMRGRKYKSNAGLLFVIGSGEKMKRKGIDVVNVNDLVIRDLAPSGAAGRFACYTEDSIKEIGERFK